MKLTNGRVTIEVRDDKAEHYALMMGYHIVRDEPEIPEPRTPDPIPEPRKPRGRPRKAS